MKHSNIFNRSLMAGAILATSLSGALAEELNFSVGLGPSSTVTVAANHYAKTVEELTNGDITVKVFPLELVSLPEMGPGIRDGLTDIGFMAAPYYPAEFAHTNFLAEQSMMMTLLEPTGKEGLAYAGAITEFIFNNCPECLAEYKTQNHVYMGHISTTPYVMLCKPEIRTIADLKGKRLRAGSAAYKRFAEHFGAVGVQMAASEAYEALSQGVLDCAMLSAGDLTNYRLQEVVDSVTLRVPGNVYGGTVAGNINRDTWQSLSNEERASLLKAGARLAAEITLSYKEQGDKDLAETKEAGKSVLEPSEELVAELRKFVEADQLVVAELFKTNYGVENASAMQEEFRPILERWVKLVDGVETLDELADVYYNENFAKLDPSSYGMN